jgi:hypothetical protein
MYLTPGPIDKDYAEGELVNWHLEVLNNSGHNALISFYTFTVSDTAIFPAIQDELASQFTCREYGNAPAG